MASGEPPEAIRRAAFELVAHTINEGSIVYTMTLNDLTHEGANLGSFEVSVRKLPD